MVKVRRIVADLAAEDAGALATFYRALFDLEPLMDQGWIVTLGAGQGPVHLSIAAEGGSGAPVPHLSIEVDDVDTVFARAQSHGAAIVYPMTEEPWGVRRFFLRDPAGRVVNVLMHI